MAAPLYAWWIDQYRDEPSQQAFWRTDLGEKLWPRRPSGWSFQPDLGAALIKEVADPAVGARRDMEEWCVGERHGSVSVKARADAIARLPQITL